ncbi:MAG: toll/interleukin-1 receptor domain-containing protein [Planctomycetes bacterium]|nr:toll/interleukin-1 receptor domain-containing protein [Planctomycetota bacterium]
MEPRPPRVFISYSHDSPAHSGRVLALARALRADGIDVELDQFHTDEIVDWPKWCNEQISREHSDFVLCICTAEYKRRIEGNVPPEKGKGVYWEGALLDDDVYDEKGNGRIIPVFFDDEPENAIPRFLRGWTHCRLRDFALTDPGYEHVIRILTGQARVEKNPLGTVPVLGSEPLPPPPTTTVAAVEIAPTRLHHGAERLFGRNKELAQLDKVRDDPAKHLLTMVAFGGVGKTSLVIEWMARQAAAAWPGFERVFDWSFYSQGMREQGAASADVFVAKALEFFGDAQMAASAASPWDKGARLAQLVAQRPTLLVLDGLEPLQHPPGPLAGKLKDPALEALLKGLALQNPGLCLVTTRERVADLAPFRDTTAPEWELEHLSTPASVNLLKTLGVRGTDEEFGKLVEEIAGHALTLNLLGQYLAKAHQGDIRKRDRVKFEKADRKIQGGHAFKTMAAYEKWLAEGGEDGARALAVLRLMGLFDRPADADCLAALRAEPAIPDLTEPLVGLEEDDWNLTLSSLADCGLVSIPEPPSQVSDCKSHIDAHPLIREYFATQLREKNPEAWRAAHRRLYEHLKDSTEHQPDTLEGLQPLYQAVAHGCQAGLQQEACVDIYSARILRGNEFYSIRKLGAFGAVLGAVACFFEQPWSRIATALSKPVQAWLLNEAAFALRALGRLTEALEPMRASLYKLEHAENWKSAAVAASNLSELELTLGQVADALHDAEQCVTLADRSGDAFLRIVDRVTLADALHQAGRRAEGMTSFGEAEAMQAERQPQHPLLYSVQGFRYCDLLLAECERAAWQVQIRRARLLPSQERDDGRLRGSLGLPDVLERCRVVEQRAAKTLEWTEAAREASLLDFGLNHVTLGRAVLYRTVLERSSFDIRHSPFREAHQQLTTAVADLRRSGQLDDIPRGLLSRAWLRFLAGDADGAGADLDEAWQIAERGPMPLYMTDIHLHRARLFHAVRPYPWESPRHDLAEAKRLIDECGYHRRDEELTDAQQAAKSW